MTHLCYSGETRAAGEAEIAARLATTAVRHLDDTGFGIAGKTRWLHTVSTAAASHYSVMRHLSGGLVALLGLLGLAAGQMEIERIAVEIGLEVAFGREAAARAAGASAYA